MIKRQMYSMTHQVANMGYLGSLTPTMIQEVAPGDTWSGKVGVLVRLSPLKRAMLMDIQVDQFCFYVPHRLVMADWESFIAEGPMASPTYSIPTVTIVGGSEQYEPLFMPSHPSESKTYAALRLYAYNLLWNEFFRDDNEAVKAPTLSPGKFGAGVNHKKDYWSKLNAATGYGDAIHYADVTAGSPDKVSALELLQALAQQKVALRRATYGTRYVDVLRSYGVNVNYQMLQRPELVAMARGSINITDVVASDGANLGDLGGHGISGTRLTLKRKTFPEHGTLMSFIILRPIFQNKWFSDWFDTARTYSSYYDPGLVPLPPVQVVGKDVVPTVAAADAGTVMGYQPWGEWYRSALSKSHASLGDWVGGSGIDQTTNTYADVRSCVASGFNTLFNELTFGHFQVSAVNKVRALRFLPRSPQGKP